MWPEVRHLARDLSAGAFQAREIGGVASTDDGQPHVWIALSHGGQDLVGQVMRRVKVGPVVERSIEQDRVRLHAT